MPEGKWKLVEDETCYNYVGNMTTSRLKVPGGWLYSVVHYNGNDARQSVTFVPDKSKA
jgi:hypothetical protein